MRCFGRHGETRKNPIGKIIATDTNSSPTHKLNFILRTAVHNAIGLVAPDLCRVCRCRLNPGETLLCVHCLADMPELNIDNFNFNNVHERFPSSAKIAKAAAWFAYSSKSPYANLIRQAKYYDMPRQARILGRMMAARLVRRCFFDSIDVVVPMPMWWGKRLRRTYNQSEEIARGIADISGLPIARNIIGAHRHSTQTHLGRIQRQLNTVGTIYPINLYQIAGRHVLLVDDIITTGATMHTAIDALTSDASNLPAAVSIAALALTGQS